jgi:hypothetical protein
MTLLHGWPGEGPGRRFDARMRRRAVAPRRDQAVVGAGIDADDHRTLRAFSAAPE